jgi:hypothetical protein
MIMAGRPPIDLDQKVRDLLTHTVPLRPGINAPIRTFEQRTNACFNLIKYIDDHVSTQPVYRASYDRHMSLLNRMVLVNLVESFERFIKEIAVVCVDAIAPVTIDNRFDQFSPTGGSLAAQFSAGSVGKAMCESDTWLSNQVINDRFKNILKPHFGEPWEILFPTEKQNPDGERARARTLSILWQVRHNITHNTGVLTDSDARRLTLMVKTKVNSRSALNPHLSDLRYVKRFLVETADHTNDRIGRRLADLLTERYNDDSTLFAPQALADSISNSFQQSLTIAGFSGTP